MHREGNKPFSNLTLMATASTRAWTNALLQDIVFR